MDENKLIEAGNEMKTKVRSAVGTAGDYVDSATTTVGRGMENAAGAIAHRVDNAADGVATSPTGYASIPPCRWASASASGC